MCEFAYDAYTSVSSGGMSFETAITIVLTALAVMLAALALGIAALAVWGYVGLRDSVKDAATKHVTETMDAKLREYPAPEDLVALVKQMEANLGVLERIQNEVVTPEASKPVAPTSNNSIKIEKYPGEEPPNASNAKADGPAATADPGPDNRETPKNRPS